MNGVPRFSIGSYRPLVWHYGFPCSPRSVCEGCASAQATPVCLACITTVQVGIFLFTLIVNGGVLAQTQLPTTHYRRNEHIPTTVAMCQSNFQCLQLIADMSATRTVCPRIPARSHTRNVKFLILSDFFEHKTIQKRETDKIGDSGSDVFSMWEIPFCFQSLKVWN